MTSTRVEFRHRHDSLDRNWLPWALGTRLESVFVISINAPATKGLTLDEKNMLEFEQKQITELVQLLFTRMVLSERRLCAELHPSRIRLESDLANRERIYGNTTWPNYTRASTDKSVKQIEPNKHQIGSGCALFLCFDVSLTSSSSSFFIPTNTCLFWRVILIYLYCFVS